MDQQTFDVLAALYKLILAEHDLNTVRASKMDIALATPYCDTRYFDAQGKVRELMQAIYDERRETGAGGGD